MACLAANLLGRVLVDALDLPVYLDMVGTAFSAVLLGPWWGAPAIMSSVWASVTVANLLTSVVDKLICGFVSLTVLESLPAPMRPRGALSGPQGPDVAVRGCSDLPRRGVEGPRPEAG